MRRRGWWRLAQGPRHVPLRVPPGHSARRQGDRLHPDRRLPSLAGSRLAALLAVLAHARGDGLAGRNEHHLQGRQGGRGSGLCCAEARCSLVVLCAGGRGLQGLHQPRRVPDQPAQPQPESRHLLRAAGPIAEDGLRGGEQRLRREYVRPGQLLLADPARRRRVPVLLVLLRAEAQRRLGQLLRDLRGLGSHLHHPLAVGGAGPPRRPSASDVLQL
mmetsp:Transcript_18924/g.56741  ORF Transcript_18924/g.56741 Transcript_18924/m.56741 type:complete len:216 (-) Transcript_18924:227-874(-)